MRSTSTTVPDYSDLSIDTAIFHNRKLTFSQALVVFLKEERKLSFASIARLLDRDQRTIYTQYTTAIQKLGTSFYRYEDTKTRIPLLVLCSRETSILESAVLHLKKQGLKNKEIAEAIGRNAKTISSMLCRIKKRGGMK